MSGLKRLTFVLGGARSGKSALAERLAIGCGLPRAYIATAQAWDDEMADRIVRHRADRGAGWLTIEEPRALPDAIKGVPAGHVTVIDCLTLWLSNEMLAEADLDRASAALRAALSAATGPVIVVSNEVGLGIVPENALARRFRDAQGRLNQAIAAEADTVLFVAAGLPMALKGTVPQ
ncbi:adenosylcobinamide kinase/adenosylcobinamide-phosphate guanylyltransferase [Rubricella aquisinus]|uniref:Bifunctional adenosylcobalamin biosynthesis protein n=1 Tax=Rubricella aquisinus TaxID=2028108 RepID=A0A840WPG6_9RHOB|nr:bifunctional adenosylcobinamide kinase/adenosylcobinamide-phosphate guanylyltransferase [Rubricella aquisinus]MBB5516948.1 adenosylcobinamide kinase/adenosylcobinamide-phosphate guanylyltransferase [Rubricella aquisinus]